MKRSNFWLINLALFLFNICYADTSQPPFGKEITYKINKVESVPCRAHYLGEPVHKIKDEDLVIFLAGPSCPHVPISKWRLDLIEKLGPYLPKETILVVPESKDRLHYEGKDLEWQHQLLERADIIALNLSLHWKNPDGTQGNIGPTTRFEVGYYLAKNKPLIILIPEHPKPDKLEWVEHQAKILNIPIYTTYEAFYHALLDKAEEFKHKDTKAQR